MPDTPQSKSGEFATIKTPEFEGIEAPPAPTEGVEPVSEVDKLIESCIAVDLRGLTRGNESTMYLPALRAAIERLIAEARIDELERKHAQVEVIKGNIVKWSNTHEALGIGWVISSADAAAHHAKQEIAQLNQMKGKTV